jgi:hypothetical protein
MFYPRCQVWVKISIGLEEMVKLFESADIYVAY